MSDLILPKSVSQERKDKLLHLESIEATNDIYQQLRENRENPPLQLQCKQILSGFFRSALAKILETDPTFIIDLNVKLMQYEERVGKGNIPEMKKRLLEVFK